MDWNDLKYFLAVSRTGSLTQAALELAVSQSTVSRRIGELESSLGFSVFVRHQTGYLLTDGGLEILKHAKQVEDEVLALERNAAGLDGSPTGTVRIATSENFATDLVIPAMPALRKRYPGICLEIITGTATTALGRREADIALRVTRPSRGNLKVRRVGHMTYSVYATRSYLEENPPVEGLPLAGRQFVTWDAGHAHLPAAVWLAREHPGCKIALVTNNLPSQIAAVRAGLGLAVIPDFLAAREGFVQVIPAEQLFSNDVWLVIHADLADSLKVRAVSDFLAEEVVNREPTLSTYE